MQESKRREGGEERPLDFSRLQEEHAKAINLSKERIDKWAQFKADYEALQARMYSLPDKLTHDVMVPFGKFAFIPGQLYDTNEILVLLGDNWFVKRSVKQALEIAERRKQNVMKMLEDEKKQMSEWEARHAFTTSFRSTVEEHEDTVEIKEEYDETKERKRKERRQRNIKSGYVPPPRPAFPKSTTMVSSKAEATLHDQTDIGQRSHPSSGKVSASKETLKRERGRGEEASGGGGDLKTTKTDEELWARLEQLEREEKEQLAKEKEEEEESSSLDDVAPGSEEKETGTSKGEGGGATASRTKKEGAVRERKVTTREKSKEVHVPSSGSSKSTTAGVPVSGPLRISVKHTPSQPAVEPAKPEKDDIEQKEQVKPVFSSPADIFKQFCKADSSDEDSPIPEKKESSSKTKSSSSPASVKKGVKWNPTLVEFSDGSKRQTSTAESSSQRKGRSSNGGKKAGDEGGKKATKPSVAFTGQVLERFSPSQFAAPSTDDGAKKKVSKFKASRKQ